MADDDTGAGTATDGDTPKKDRKKQIKNEHVLIGVGIVTLILTALYLRKSSANAAAATAAQQTAANPYGTAYDPNAYDSSGTSYDAYTGLEGEIQALQSEFAGLSTSTGANGASPNPAPSTPTPGPTLTPPPNTLPLSGEVVQGMGYSAGPGYESGIIEGQGGSYYATSATADSSNALFSSGGAYYEPSLGVFQQVTDPNMQKKLVASGTTEYSKYQ